MATAGRACIIPALNDRAAEFGRQALHVSGAIHNSVENAWDILYDEASRGLHDVSLVNECIRLMANGDFFSTSLDSKEAPHGLSDHGHAALAGVVGHSVPLATE
jgi:hypothetical protein